MTKQEKYKNVEAVVKVFGIVLLVTGFIGLMTRLSVLILQNQNAQKSLIDLYSIKMHILISSIVYIVLEILLLFYINKVYCNKSEWTFPDFLFTNSIIAIVSTIFGWLSFASFYLVKNIPGAVVKTILVSYGFLAENDWLIELVVIVGLVVLVKWLLYKIYILRARGW